MRILYRFKKLSVAIAFLIFFQSIFYYPVFASGPSQPEYASFKSSGDDNYVNLYTGDFSYSIPLLTVPGPNGGYPISMHYNSNIGMNDEASWVGLGWNLNIGSINRQMRGIPDDFNGEQIKKKVHLRENTTTAINLFDVKNEKLGLAINSPSGLRWQVYYNNFKGLVYKASHSFFSKNPILSNTGVDISFDSQNGIGIEPNLSLNYLFKNTIQFQSRISSSYNSRQGLYNYSLGSSYSIYKQNIAYANLNSGLSFSTVQSFPEIKIPTKTITLPMEFSLGKSITPGTLNSKWSGTCSGYYSTTSVANDGNIVKNAYGYLYTSNGSHEDDLKDFNRQDVSYSKKLPNLPIGFHNYDLYYQTGEGSSNMIRPYLGSHGTLSEVTQANKSNTYETGFESTVTGTYVGVDFSLSSSKEQSGKWSNEGNNADKEAELQNLNYSNSNKFSYEPFYFKVYGEKTGCTLQNDDLAKWGNDKAIKSSLEISNDPNWFNRQFVAADDYIPQENASPLFQLNSNTHKYRPIRSPRETYVKTLSTAQAELYGNSRHLTYRDLSSNKTVSKSFSHPEKQLSEISVLQSDGSKYTYGLPVYNKKHVESSFSVDPSNKIANKALVKVPNKNGAIDVSNTYHEFLDQTELPEYATNWLLTQITSDDYVDIDNNGPSENDYGYWVKFNYKKTADNYQWRSPYENANYFEGKKGDPNDDQGSFVYGEKELYYLESVETKTHIAIFTTSLRDDAIQSKSFIDGGLPANPTPSMKLHKLDGISLYSKEDYKQSSHPICIQKINLNYNYELCPQAPGSIGNKGKLTLKKLYSTFQTSNKGAQHAYQFNYGNNLAYNEANVDRWGFYKNNSQYTNSSYPFLDMSYSVQDAPPNNNQWLLTEINTPEGSTMNIEYEADDYAYVENKRALRMFDIVGAGKEGFNSHSSKTSTLNNIATLKDDKYKIYFKLEKPISSDDKNYIYQHYLSGIENLYFKVYADLKNNQFPNEADYVSGYAKINHQLSSCGAIQSAGSGMYDIGYLTVLEEDLTKNAPVLKAHPFRKAAIQHLRVNRPELVHTYTGVNSNNAMNNIVNLALCVFTMINDLTSAIASFNNYAFIKNYGKKIYLDGKSIIRLNDPDKIKYGGGARVKKIKINDQWQNTSVNDQFTYGKEFEYKLEENGENISSGVAYEPAVGKEESALVNPIEYEESTLLGSSEDLYLSTPLAEGYYPSPSVGYRKVTVRSIGNQQAMAELNTPLINAAPLSIYEFYTPKDFPVIFSQTDLNADAPIKIPLIAPPVYNSFKKRKARTQGYVVKLNDMAGKPKSITQKTFHGNKTLSSQEFIYQTKTPYSESKINELDNQVYAITNDFTIQSAILGRTFDLIIDEDERSTEYKEKGVELNVMTLFPYVIPIPEINKLETNLRTHTTTKVIYQTGILKEVKATTQESTIKTENVAYDLETGTPVLLKTYNEFDDPLYSYTQLGHWHYKNMKGSYKNEDIELQNLQANNGSIELALNINGELTNLYFTEGDVLFINFTNGMAGFYTISKKFITGNKLQLTCLDDAGNSINNGTVSSLKIIQSGYKNISSTVIGSISAKELSCSNDLNNRKTFFSPIQFELKKIINAAAVEYKNEWNVLCDTAATINASCTCTPSEKSKALIPLINELLQDSLVNEKNVLLYDTTNNSFHHRFSPALKQIFLNDKNIYYTGSINNQLLTIILSHSSISFDTDFYCTIKINLGANYSWSSINKITTISTLGLSESNESCDRAKMLQITALINGTQNTEQPIPISITGCFENTVCLKNYTYSGCGININNPYNPYKIGQKGIFRKDKEYSYQIDRQSTGNTREDGVYSSFASFSWSNKLLNNYNNWIERNTNTIYSPYGFPLEAKDALNNHTTSLYGYNHSLPVASAQNAQLHEIAFDDFETYPNGCSNKHFNFSDCNPTISATQAHTGNNSMELKKNQVISKEVKMYTNPCQPQNQKSITNKQNYKTSNTQPNKECVCIPNFMFVPGQKYVFSSWIKESDTTLAYQAKTYYDQSKISVSFFSGSTLIKKHTINAAGPIIEGWQKAEDIFVVPSNTTKALISIENSSNQSISFIDDIRIHPFDANMVSYVYDKKLLKPMSVLDENNYASFFIYDEEGNKVKEKKETIDGIKTINEGRANIKKQ